MVTGTGRFLTRGLLRVMAVLQSRTYHTDISIGIYQTTISTISTILPSNIPPSKQPSLPSKPPSRHLNRTTISTIQPSTIHPPHISTIPPFKQTSQPDNHLHHSTLQTNNHFLHPTLNNHLHHPTLSTIPPSKKTLCILPLL